ncbi:hypothetical protein ABI_17130 [Asticcacaulis biprosthecium C19]|uniref:THAP4-like heme-binding beta-barrel domain-containing protein n=1 Tax=Asticcacaulis biprosthecium C19 TaxID=715226 RepID=F4QK95_9CAUL|nr:hypothetical protein [Asticcacaulis biprosthecium]EGF93273.1 hypothetical protein ABI_17130 [Asticcacaulis biprosthecium C19]
MYVRAYRSALGLGLSLALMVSVAQPGQAQPAPRPETLQAGLSGRWSGYLEYRDYQSNEAFRLPMVSYMSVAPDTVTVTRLSSFDDGPQTGMVFITTTTLYGDTGATSAMFRKGRVVEVVTDQARVARAVDAVHWTVIFERDGVDGGQESHIRETETRDGDTLTRLKEVKPLGGEDSAYVFRNITVLSRAPSVP